MPLFVLRAISLTKRGQAEQPMTRFSCALEVHQQSRGARYHGQGVTRCAALGAEQPLTQCSNE